MAYLTDAEFERRRNERDARQTQRMQEMNNVLANDSTGAAIGLGVRQLPGLLKDYAMHYIDASNNSGFARGYSGFKRGLTGNAYQSPEAAQAAEQQTTQPTGGQAIAAEQKQRNSGEPVALTETAETGGGTSTTETRRLGGVDANVETDQNGSVTSVFSGTPNSPGYGMIRLTGTPNPQQAQRPQPGLGYNQDAAQQAAVNQYGGIGSVRQVQGRPDLFAVRGNAGGYGFQGSARDAALFGAPVFNSAHRVQDGPNETFLRYRAEERARRAAPQPEEQGPMGWKRLKAKADNESRERIADMTTRLGYSTDAARNALTREQLAQQYGINMAQLGNDALRTQAALGLSGLQQQQAMQQMRQQQMLDNARQTYATARPGSQEWIQARRFIEASNSGKENERKPERAMMELPDGTKAPIQYNDDGTYTRMTEAQTGGDNRDYSLSDKEKKAISKNIPDNMKAAFERDPEGFMRHYAAIMGL